MSVDPSHAVPSSHPVDFAAIKQRQQATSASGNFAVIGGTTLQIVGERLVESADVRAGEQVLDVAAGNGNASLAVARRFAALTSTDFVPALLDSARALAQADGLADVEQLPSASRRFDVVLSTFACMFAPDQTQVARELLRVTRPGGRIGLVNWTPEGFIGQLLQVVGRHVPPPAGLGPPTRGDGVAPFVALFVLRALDPRVQRRQFSFRHDSAEQWLQVFRDDDGPVHKAFAALPAAGQGQLEADILALLRRFNADPETSLVIPGDYLEVVITVD